jgi:uncharacterized protein GlcG (DUF336 family)
MSPTRPVTTLTLEAAQLVVRACVEAADARDKPMAIAVVDAAGHPKAVVTMDGAALLAEDVARRKAWSAVAWNMPTMDWVDFMGQDPVLQHGIPQIKGLTVLGGGVPLHVDGVTVGGVGVSGSHYTEDEAVARAGVDALERVTGG